MLIIKFGIPEDQTGTMYPAAPDADKADFNIREQLRFGNLLSCTAMTSLHDT